MAETPVASVNTRGFVKTTRGGVADVRDSARNHAKRSRASGSPGSERGGSARRSRTVDITLTTRANAKAMRVGRGEADGASGTPDAGAFVRRRTITSSPSKKAKYSTG